jgi:UDP-2-acetamido-3-amino-2,3-dideoxy-glucuronate N-acetyltransferase
MRGEIRIKYGASVGAGAIILPNVTIGRFAMVGAGAVVTRDVLDHRLAMGIPARFIGYVCRCGRRLQQMESGWNCPTCDWFFQPADENT